MYETREHAGAFVVRWVGTPTHAAVLSLRREILGALAKAPGAVPLWIVIDTARAQIPSPRARTALQESARELADLAGSVDIVVLGDGVGASLTRTLLRTMIVLARVRERQRVHDSIEDAALTLALDPKLVAVLRGESA